VYIHSLSFLKVPNDKIKANATETKIQSCTAGLYYMDVKTKSLYVATVQEVIE